MGAVGVRARATGLAMAVVALAALLGSIVLLTTLRQSLVDEIDRANLSRADDIATQWASENELIVLGAGFDNFTFAAVFDATGFYADTDPTAEIDALLPTIETFNEPFESAIALDETLGSQNLRNIAILADDPDGISESTVAELTDDDPIILVSTSLDPVDDTVRAVSIGAAVVGPIFVLLVGLLTWFLTGRSLRPVEDIRREVENISATGLDRRVPEPPSDDEIGRLATTMNHMLGRLERSQQAQQQFVADASHELRSPLASMSAILDVAERHGTDDEWPDTAADLQRETKRMRRMVDDLLLLARADAGRSGRGGLIAGDDLVDVDDLVLEVIASLPASERDHIDTSEVSAGLVTGSRDQLQRVVINLVDNGLRHCDQRVEITVAEVDDRVVCTVGDDGPGIPPDQRGAVFDRFVRLDDARSRDAGGSGLGLAIAHEVVAAHGGSIIVSASEIGGALLTVSLPSRS